MWLTSDRDIKVVAFQNDRRLSWLTLGILLYCSTVLCIAHYSALSFFLTSPAGWIENTVSVRKGRTTGHRLDRVDPPRARKLFRVPSSVRPRLGRHAPNRESYPSLDTANLLPPDLAVIKKSVGLRGNSSADDQTKWGNPPGYHTPTVQFWFRSVGFSTVSDLTLFPVECSVLSCTVHVSVSM
jgi:hypothetical protein